MTADDSARDDARRDADDASDPDAQPQPPLDEEAAWQLIVANYGERPRLDADQDTDQDTDQDPGAPTAPADTSDTEPPPPAPQRPSRDPFDRSYLDAMDAGRSEPAPRQDRRRDDQPGPLDVPGAPPADRDEHFVPPEPPPVPRATPGRRLGWCGLFLPPLLMLAAVVLDWTFPSWVALGLVAAFIGGFVFLVATMPRDGGDGWGDGAVV